MDTRRLLRKSRQRRIRFTAMLKNVVNLYKNKNYKVVKGPAYGFVRAVDNLNGTVKIHKSDIIISFPNRVNLDLFTIDMDEAKAKIEDAARFTILQQLNTVQRERW